MKKNLDDIKQAIRDIPDFPKPGILFKDITPVLLAPELFRAVIDLFEQRYRGQEIDKIAIVDARGFILGSALAYNLGLGLVPIRKQGKLPYDSVKASYDLEYGSATLEVHRDAVQPGERIVIIDDLLATGGTAEASIDLITQLGGEVVEAAFLVELAFLGGRARLAPHPVFSPVIYD